MMSTLCSEEACRLSVSETEEQLRSDTSSGLDQEEVIRRRSVHGYNEFEITKGEPLWKKYLGQFNDPLILLLLASAVISICMKKFDDAISISMTTIIIVTVVFMQEYRLEKSLEALTKLVPPKCHCLRDGKLMTFLARELVPGDVVYLAMGDRVPADLRLFEATDLDINETCFTGEMMLCPKMTAAQPQQTNIGIIDRKNVAYMGTQVRCGRGKGIVIGTGDNSEFGEILKFLQEEESPKTPLPKSMDTLGKQLSFYSFCIIGCIMFLGWIQGQGLLHVFTVGVSLAVAAIPESLHMVVTVTVAISVKRMANRKAIVKKLPIVETLGCTTVVCSDKTGTLTKNEMTVTQILTADGMFAEVTGVGYNASGEVVCDTQEVRDNSHPSLTKVIEVGCICNDTEICDDGLHGQPTEGALIACARKMNIHHVRDLYVRLDEWPFNSETKCMTVKCTQQNGNSQEIIYFVKGALEKVLSISTRFHSHGSDLPLPEKQKSEYLDEASRMGSAGLRVLAMAYGSDPQNLIFVGLVGIIDPPRPDVREAICTLMGGGVAIKMVTWDTEEIAKAIGTQLGLYAVGNRALSGDQIDEMDTDTLKDIINSTTVFYRTAARHKVKIIQALQAIGHVVAMTDEGICDAVALKRADIGISMGRSGTVVSNEAADLILEDGDFCGTLCAIEEGKTVVYNIRNVVQFQLSTNIAALSLIALSTLMQLPNPLNAMQILWINIIMDGPPAHSVSVESVDRDVIRQPPCKVKNPIITKSLISNVLMSAAIIVLGTLWVFWMEMSDNKITPRDTTMTFTCFVFFDLFNALSCRSQEKSIFQIGFFTNKVFLMAVGGSIIGQLLVIYFPPLQAVFQTEALYFHDFVLLIVLTSSVFVASEIRKSINRVI